MKAVSSFRPRRSGPGSIGGSDDLDAGMTPATPEMRRRGLFGRKVRLLRESLSLSQEDFCERFELTLEDLVDWERGRVMPDDRTLERIRAIEADPRPAPRRGPSPGP